MAQKILILGLSLAAASPLSATPPSMTPAEAPQGGPSTKYCMRIEAITGSRLEQVRCWTRQEWADEGVDVDKDWPKEGVRVIG